MTKSRLLSRDPRFQYLTEADRYVTKGPQPEVSFNLIGAGIIGQEHIRVTALEGRGKIHGVYDPHPPSVRAAAKIMDGLGAPLTVYKDLASACTDPEADALLICTPNHTHLEVLEQAVLSGKPILLEKPMATSVRDAYRILEIAEEYGNIIQVGLQYRYKSIYREAVHEARERKSLGDVKTISIMEHRIPFLDKVGQWNKFSALSGGTLVEKCCHYFDLFNLFAASRPVRVFASGSQAVNYKDFDQAGSRADILDNAFVIVEYENGVRANFNLSMFAPLFYEEMILCGTEGRLKVFEKEDFLKGGLECSVEVHQGEEHPVRTSSPHYLPFIEESGHSGATFFEHREFIDNLRGAETRTATPREGFWSVVVGAAAEESVRRNTPVMIDTLLEEEGIRI